LAARRQSESSYRFRIKTVWVEEVAMGSKGKRVGQRLRSRKKPQKKRGKRRAARETLCGTTGRNCDYSTCLKRGIKEKILELKLAISWSLPLKKRIGGHTGDIRIERART